MSSSSNKSTTLGDPRTPSQARIATDDPIPLSGLEAGNFYLTKLMFGRGFDGLGTGDDGPSAGSNRAGSGGSGAGAGGDGVGLGGEKRSVTLVTSSYRLMLTCSRRE